MSNRVVVFLSVLLAFAVGATLSAFAQSSLEPKQSGLAQVAPIEFYLAHGESDACGPGCDEWIAAEGKIDAHAADRLRQLLNKLQGRRPPIFFHSPGGSVNGALELGRLIHQKKLDTSVGHTVPLGCDSDKPDKPCSVQSATDKPVLHEISQFVAECNSGCVYALAAGATHLVPPWVKLGIHDVGLDPDVKIPFGAVPALGIAEGRQRVRAYFHDMGMDPALFQLILATPFEKPKLLERDDIVRFGLDRREFGQTAWQFANTTPAQIRKRFFVRTDGEQPHYVNGMLGVICSTAGMSVFLAREPLESDSDLARTAPVIVGFDLGGKQIPLRRVTLPRSYIRAGSIRSLDGAIEKPIELPGPEFGRKLENPVTLNMDGFSTAYAKLAERCTSPTSQAPQIAQTPQAPQTSQTGLQGLVQQFQAHPERYGYPHPKPGAPGGTKVSIVPNAVLPSNKEPATVEFSRFAAPEQKVRVDLLFLLKPDCSSAGTDAVSVVEQPQHGTLTIEASQGVSAFAEKDPRAVCNTRNSDAFAVIYQANKDYQGPDSASVSITLPLAGAVTHHYTIRVK